MACDNITIRRFKVRFEKVHGDLSSVPLIAPFFSGKIQIPGIKKHSDLSTGEEETEVFNEQGRTVSVGNGIVKTEPLLLSFGSLKSVENELIKGILTFWDNNKNSLVVTIYVDVTDRNFCTKYTYVYVGCKLLQFKEPGAEKGKATLFDYEIKVNPYKVYKEFPGTISDYTGILHELSKTAIF